MKFNKREISNGINGESSKLFLRLKDGDKVTGVCRGEIYEFQTKWENGKSSVVTEGGKPRFRVNFVVHEDGRFIAKIWEFGVKVYNALADIHEVYPLDQTKVRVSRSGSTKDNTTYNILPIVNEKIGAKSIKEIEAVELNVLNHRETMQDRPAVKNYAPSTQKSSEDDDIGF